MPRLRWMFVAALASLLFFIAATVYYFEFQRLSHLQSAVAERGAKLEEKERSVKNYRERVAFYRTDEGLAHLAREQYNLAFPGERIFIISRDSAESVTEVILR